jgi:hypothetical protein
MLEDFQVHLTLWHHEIDRQARKFSIALLPKTASFQVVVMDHTWMRNGLL